MGIFSWILLGLIAGALAKFIMPGKDPGGIFVTILIGIAGAIIGGFLGSFIGVGKVESFDLGGIFIATIGAIILLIVIDCSEKDRSHNRSISTFTLSSCLTCHQVDRFVDVFWGHRILLIRAGTGLCLPAESTLVFRTKSWRISMRNFKNPRRRLVSW